MTIGILDAFLDGFTGVGFYERVRLPGPPTTYRQAMIALSYGFAASLTVIAALSTWSFMTIRRRLMFLSVLCSPGSSSDQFASVETIDHFEENLGTRDRPIRNAAPATAGPISLMGSISNSCTDEHNKCDGEEAAEEEEKDPADQVEEEGGYLEGKMDHGIPLLGVDGLCVAGSQKARGLRSGTAGRRLNGGRKDQVTVLGNFLLMQL
jgi:hypothetical protein